MQEKTTFTLSWMWGTFMGCVLGYVSAFLIVVVGTEVTTPFLHGSEPISDIVDGVCALLIVLLAVIIGGVTFGFAQWKAALHGKVAKGVWILTSIISTCSGFAVAYIVSLILGRYAQAEYLGIVSVCPGHFSGMDDRFLLGPLWLVGVIGFGVSWGIATGIPQWLVLRRYFYQTNRWLTVTIVGSLAMFGTFAAAVFAIGNTVVAPTLGCCFGPTVFSAVTGAVLYGILMRPKQLDKTTTQQNGLSTPLAE